MAVKYAKIEVSRFQRDFFGDPKAWKPEQIESVVEDIIEGIRSYKRPAKVEADYLIGEGGRIEKVDIKSEDGLIVGQISYDSRCTPSLDIEIDFKAEGEEHKEAYIALEKIVKGSKK